MKNHDFFGEKFVIGGRPCPAAKLQQARREGAAMGGHTTRRSSISQLEQAVIAVADEVINPLSPEYFSVDGIEIFLVELRKIEDGYRRKINRQL
jgi:hypothetical protein